MKIPLPRIATSARKPADVSKEDRDRYAKLFPHFVGRKAGKLARDTFAVAFKDSEDRYGYTIDQFTRFELGDTLAYGCRLLNRDVFPQLAAQKVTR